MYSWDARWLVLPCGRWSYPSPTFGPLAQDTYEPNDPEAIQKSFARHLEYSLACTRFNFTMQDGFTAFFEVRGSAGRTVGRWDGRTVGLTRNEGFWPPIFCENFQDAYRAAGLVLRDRLLAPWKTKQRYRMNKHFQSLVFSRVFLTKVPQFQILCLLEILCEFFWRLCTFLVDFKVMTNVSLYPAHWRNPTCIISVGKYGNKSIEYIWKWWKLSPYFAMLVYNNLPCKEIGSCGKNSHGDLEISTPKRCRNFNGETEGPEVTVECFQLWGKFMAPFPPANTWNQNFHLKYIFNPRNPWTIPTLITGLGQKGGVVGYCGTKRGWGLQWCLRGFADFDARKMDVKRGYYLSAEYLIGRHMQPLWFDRFVVGFVFFCLWKWTKIVKKSWKKSCTSHSKFVGFLGFFGFFGSSKSSPCLAHPKSLQLRNAIANLDLEQPFKVGETPSGRRVGSKKARKGDFSWDKKPEVLDSKKSMEIKPKPSTTHAQFWWFLFWLAK